MINLQRHTFLKSGAGWRQRMLTVNSVLLLLLLLNLTECIPTPSCSAAESKNKAVSEEELKEGVKTFRINIQRLQEGIAAQREQFTEVMNEERNLLDEIETIDKRLADQTAKLNALQERKNAQEAVIALKEQELSDVRSEKEKVQRHLQKRINAYFKMGNIGLLNVTFSSQTLPEMLKFHDAFQTLIAYDQNVIAIYRKTIDKLEQTTKTLSLEKTVLTDFISQAVAEQNVIDAIKIQKETLLHRVRTQSKLHEQAIAEMEKAADDLSAALLALKTKEQKSEQGFLQKKGALPPPVSGIVVALFQQEITNSLGIRKKSEGIAIKTPEGSKVKTIFPGTVIYAGYLRGYGNTIIVHHGFQYYSVISRVEKILTAKDSSVEAGSILAETGDTATLVEEGVYFEIRHGSTTLDPMRWLAPNTLQYREDLPSK